MIDSALISVYIILELIEGILLKPIFFPPPHILVIVLTSLVLVHQCLVSPTHNRDAGTAWSTGIGSAHFYQDSYQDGTSEPIPDMLF